MQCMGAGIAREGAIDRKNTVTQASHARMQANNIPWVYKCTFLGFPYNTDNGTLPLSCEINHRAVSY